MAYKVALTGAPGSGKSSVLREIEFAYGERIIPESAEDIIRYLQAKGVSRPWELPDFQDKILRLQIQREKQTENIEGRIFIDRGILDGLAYYQLKKVQPSESMRQAVRDTAGRYQRVFLIELGNDCQMTRVRREDIEEAKKLETLQFENYTLAGYKVERIPYVGIEERARRILESLEDLKGGEERWKRKMEERP